MGCASGATIGAGYRVILLHVRNTVQNASQYYESLKDENLYTLNNLHISSSVQLSGSPVARTAGTVLCMFPHAAALRAGALQGGYQTPRFELYRLQCHTLIPLCAAKLGFVVLARHPSPL